MGVDGSDRDVERLRDLLIRMTEGEHLQDVPLSIGDLSRKAGVDGTASLAPGDGSRYGSPLATRLMASISRRPRRSSRRTRRRHPTTPAGSRLLRTSPNR